VLGDDAVLEAAVAADRAPVVEDFETGEMLGDDVDVVATEETPPVLDVGEIGLGVMLPIAVNEEGGVARGVVSVACGNVDMPVLEARFIKRSEFDGVLRSRVWGSGFLIKR
jgi:hypothetical protein